MSEEVLVVDGDLLSLSRSIRSVLDGYQAGQPGTPLAEAGRGMPGTHAASMCQTVAGVLDSEWNELATSLKDFADSIDEVLASIMSTDSDVASAFSSIAEQVKPAQDVPAARSRIPQMR